MRKRTARPARPLYRQCPTEVSDHGGVVKRLTWVRADSALLVRALLWVCGQADGPAVGSAGWAVGHIFWSVWPPSVEIKLKPRFSRGQHSRKASKFSPV